MHKEYLTSVSVICHKAVLDIIFTTHLCSLSFHPQDICKAFTTHYHYEAPLTRSHLQLQHHTSNLQVLTPENPLIGFPPVFSGIATPTFIITTIPVQHMFTPNHPPHNCLDSLQSCGNKLRLVGIDLIPT